MHGTVAVQPPSSPWLPLPKPRICFPGKLPNSGASQYKIHTFALLSTFPHHFSLQIKDRFHTRVSPNASFSSTFTLLSTFPHHFSLQIKDRFHSRVSPNASFSSASASVGSAEYIEEPSTNVKFQTSLTLPECSSPLSLLGTGYREKVFAIIGVKVYAAGLYLNDSIFSKFNAWKGRSAAEIQEDSSLFDSIFQTPQEKALQIVLVRDVDGKTFWDALDEAVSPRIKAATPVDESALSTLRSIFQRRSLRKGTFIFLTWMEPSKLLVCISSDGLPASVDATIKSMNVAMALFDVFFGNSPVSPSLKASVANGLATILK